jgi:alpha,alpha-trehalase
MEIIEKEDKQATAYILRAWETLTRSTNECTSLTDVKVITHPVLYLPADMAVPAEVASLRDTCYVQIRSLPQVIARMGDVKPEHLPSPGLLYLPSPYVVPGGRFNEMYGWDSYFIVLGLMHSGLHDLARGIVENFLFEIEHYGAVLNANRTYYLTRSQPPLLTGMIRSLYEDGQSFTDAKAALTWLDDAYQAAKKYYETWSQPYRLAGNTGLTRYYDVDCGPVPELADDSRYFHDVIDWLLAHRDADPGYLTQVSPAANGAATHPALGCNPRTGVAHERAVVQGYGLTDDFYLGDRAMRESGYDSSFRFGPFCGSTHHYAPVCLNSFLYKYERDMAHFAELLTLEAEKQLWNSRADQRADAIHKYLWQEDAGLFMDYDFVQGRASSYDYLSAYYPLWAGLATKHQAELLRGKVSLFERQGGLAMSSTESGMQWDEPYGWAPSNWMAVKGLYSYGFHEDALRIATAFMATIDENFVSDATVREKYDVIEKDIEVHVTAGYKQNVIGFGWTNGVYLMMREMITGQTLATARP